MSTPIVDGWVVDQWGDAVRSSAFGSRCEVSVVRDGRVTVIIYALATTIPVEVFAHQLRAAGWTVTPPKAGES